MLLSIGLKRSLNRNLCACWVVLLAAGLLAVGGCSTHPKPEPTPRPVVLGKPVIDFAKGGGGLPLEAKNRPASLEELISGLVKGFELRVESAEPAATVVATGAYPNLENLTINLSGGTVKQRYRPKFNMAQRHVESGLFARNFEYIADPLHYQHCQTHWHIQASDVRFGILRDGDGKPSLVMTDVTQGQMQFSVRMDELKPMLLASAKTHARGGFWVSDVTLDLKAPNPHEAIADMHVKAVWLLVPAAFHLHAHAVLDDDCNVTLSDVRCTPDDVGGALLAGFIDSAVAKYNNRKMPLAVWPGNRIILRDARLEVGQELRFGAWFEGRGRMAAK